jgi:hypothetical protein
MVLLAGPNAQHSLRQIKNSLRQIKKYIIHERNNRYTARLFIRLELLRKDNDSRCSFGCCSFIAFLFTQTRDIVKFIL